MFVTDFVNMNLRRYNFNHFQEFSKTEYFAYTGIFKHNSTEFRSFNMKTHGRSGLRFERLVLRRDVFEEAHIEITRICVFETR